MITLEAMGLNEAANGCEELAAALSEYSGCYYRGSTRTDGKRNAAIVGYLAENEPQRDLRTFSDKVADDLGRKFAQQVQLAMSSMLNKKGELKKPYAKKPDYERAKIQAARAWRVVGRDFLELMWKRVSQQQMAGENGNDVPAEKVGEDYARARAAKYGVDEGSVFIATGQLFDDLHPDDGKIALTKGTAAMGRIQAAKEIDSAIKGVMGEFGI